MAGPLPRPSTRSPHRMRTRRRSVLLVAALGASITPAVLAAPSGAAGELRSGMRPLSVASVTVSPVPGSLTAPAASQISIVGVPASRIGTVTVTGSKSGVHAGVLEAYSQGDGGSFVPSTPFTAGETVRVRTSLHVLGASRGSWVFKVATPASTARSTLGGPAISGNSEKAANSGQQFVSAPTLHPPNLFVDVRQPGIAPGFVFIGSRGTSGQQGVEILDNYGHAVWFDPVGPVLNFRAQEYLGKPVLTWWQGRIGPGFGKGEYVIMNSSYRRIAIVHAGNGLQGDLHEFLLEPNGAALMTAYQAVRWNVTSVGGPSTGTAIDSIAQEVDVKTGLVRFQWDSLDHVPVTQSYISYSNTLFDYFHINSIEPFGGRLIISGRNVSQIYEVVRRTGNIVWQLGGKHSSFKMGTGTPFAWQHDAELHRGNVLTVFDDEASPPVNPPSRGLMLRLDTTNRTATLMRSFVRNPPLIVGSQGNVQELPNGNRFVGWGAQPDASEFTSSGAEIFDLELPSVDSSYRAFRLPWTGAPTTSPAIVVKPSSGGDTAYVSWNGATEVASWRVLGGSSPTTLSAVGSKLKRGFEVRIPVPSRADYQLEAINRAGAVIGRSGVVSPS